MKTTLAASLLIVANTFSVLAQPKVILAPDAVPECALKRYTTEQETKQCCPSDVVVWDSGTAKRLYYFNRQSCYARTNNGSYMCEKGAIKIGLKPTGTSTCSWQRPKQN